MLRRLGTLASPPMLVALLALVVALGGVSWAAATLPRNSVGTPQLKAEAVTGAKVRDRSLTARDFAADQVPAGARGPAGPAGLAGPPGEPGEPGAAGSPAYALVTGRGVISQQNRSFSLDGTRTVVGGADDVTTLSPSVPTTLRNLRVEATVAPGAASFYALTVVVDGTQTSVCLMEGLATTCEAASPVTIPAGSEIGLRVLTNVGSATTTLRWGMSIGG